MLRRTIELDYVVQRNIMIAWRAKPQQRRECSMAYENAGKIGQEQMDNAMKSLAVVTRGFQQIAQENGEFAKRSIEQTTHMAEKFAQVRSLDKAIELQNEYVKSAYEMWMSQATKMGELYTNIARETYKPFETAAYAAADFGADTAKQGV